MLEQQVVAIRRWQIHSHPCFGRRKADVPGNACDAVDLVTLTYDRETIPPAIDLQRGDVCVTLQRSPVCFVDVVEIERSIAIQKVRPTVN